MKILVTGATGFFGRAIVPRLRRNKHTVIGASSARTSDIYTDRLDITSLKSCRQLFSRHENVDAVVHCAAIAHASPGMYPDIHYHNTNALGTKNIIDSAIDFGAKKFVMISTVSVYGEFDLPDLVSESTTRNPLGPYGISKKNAEDYCFERKDEIDLYTFRMTPMYGNDWLFNIRGKVVAPVIGKFFLVRMDSESHRYSFCSNRNGAEAVLWAIENRMKPEIYNVADDYDYCLNDVLNGVISVEGKKAVLNIPRFLPVLLMKLLIRILRGRDRKANWKSRYWKFFRNNVYSTARLKSTGFNARPHFLDVVVRGEPELHKP